MIHASRSFSPQILVVDDSQETSELAVMTLAMEGFDAAAVTSGRQALELLERSQPYCVLLDFDMPDMDGLDVARWIRARFGDDIVLIVITGSQDTDQERLKELLAVVDHHFLKPLNWDALLRILEPLTR